MSHRSASNAWMAGPRLPEVIIQTGTPPNWKEPSAMAVKETIGSIKDDIPSTPTARRQQAA